VNTFDPDNHEERWAHERAVREATGGRAGRCLDCGDPLPAGVSWHEGCWLRAALIDQAVRARG
jgi:hypothetical protein